MTHDNNANPNKANAVPWPMVGTRYDPEREALLRVLAVRLAKETGDRSFVKVKSRIVAHALDNLLEEAGLLEEVESRKSGAFQIAKRRTRNR